MMLGLGRRDLDDCRDLHAAQSSSTAQRFRRHSRFLKMAFGGRQHGMEGGSIGQTVEMRRRVRCQTDVARKESKEISSQRARPAMIDRGSCGVKVGAGI